MKLVSSLLVFIEVSLWRVNARQRSMADRQPA